jgi:hypothetical protein
MFFFFYGPKLHDKHMFKNNPHKTLWHFTARRRLSSSASANYKQMYLKLKNTKYLFSLHHTYRLFHWKSGQLLLPKFNSPKF